MEHNSLGDLAVLGLAPTTENVRRYGESQRTVYHIAGRAVGQFLEATGHLKLDDDDHALLGDAMALMRYADDMIDLYGVPEAEFVMALSDRSAAPAFYDLAERLGSRAGQFRIAIERLLAASIVQRSCSDLNYPSAKALEGQAAGEVLWAVVGLRCHEAEQKNVHAFLMALSAASNLWDALWDLREDGRGRPLVTFYTLASLLTNITRLVFSQTWSTRFAATLVKLTYRYYFKRSARHKWAAQSRQMAWLKYRAEHR